MTTSTTRHLGLGLLLGLLIVSLAAGCGKKGADAKKGDEKAKAEKTDKAPAKGEKAPAKGQEATENAAKAPKKKDGTVQLAKFGLVGTAVAGAKVGDDILGKGHMVQGPGLVVTVTPATEMNAADAKAAKEEADMYSPLEWKEEKLADGWLVTFQNKGGMGTNYWVQARRKIGGKDVMCETTASQKAQQDNAAAFCKSLKAK